MLIFFSLLLLQKRKLFLSLVNKFFVGSSKKNFFWLHLCSAFCGRRPPHSTCPAATSTNAKASQAKADFFGSQFYVLFHFYVFVLGTNLDAMH
jgi:hypothetical protein